VGGSGYRQDVWYRSTSKSVFSVNYHVIWRPKYRRRVLVGPVERRLKAIIAGVTPSGGVVIEVQTMPDHVHLLVEVPAQVSPSWLVQILKGRSSRLLRGEFPHLARMRCVWSPLWFIFTVGGASLGLVRRCVENQQVVAARKRAG
jgi:putative transposase